MQRQRLRSLAAWPQRLIQRIQRFYYQSGSPGWLIASEKYYGGFIQGVPRRTVSPFDPRSKAELERGGMQGGDRMLRHGYASHYARELRPFIKSSEPLVIAEFGILTGLGLALWCDCFPDARIMGFDIDLTHFDSHRTILEGLGAFRKNMAEIHLYDQFVENTNLLRSILDGNRINVCIDDGHHSDESILTTLSSVKPFLAEQFAYFIEDNNTVHEKIKVLHPEFLMSTHGELTILTPLS